MEKSERCSLPATVDARLALGFLTGMFFFADGPNAKKQSLLICAGCHKRHTLLHTYKIAQVAIKNDSCRKQQEGLGESLMGSQHAVAAAALAVLFVAVVFWFWCSAAGSAGKQLQPLVATAAGGDRHVVFRSALDGESEPLTSSRDHTVEDEDEAEAEAEARAKDEHDARDKANKAQRTLGDEAQHTLGDEAQRTLGDEAQHALGVEAQHALGDEAQHALGGRNAQVLSLRRRLHQLPPPRKDCPLHFRIPVRFKDGVPMVSVRIEGQPGKFVGVADTGSHHLNVNADTCKSCDGTYGSFVTTPEMFAQPTVWLRYGTQHDAAKVVRNAGVQLHAGGPAIPADVHVTVDRVMAASNFNVVGLLRRAASSAPAISYASSSYDSSSSYASSSSSSSSSSSGSGGRAEALPALPEFLAQILPPTSALYIRLYGGQHQGFRDRGFVAGVCEQAVGALRRNATVRTSLLPSLATVGSYIVALTGVRVGGREIGGAPRFLLIDTGSNMTSFSREVFADMMPALLRGATLTLEIDRQPVDIAASTYTYMEEQEQEQENDDQQNHAGQRNREHAGPRNRDNAKYGEPREPRGPRESAKAALGVFRAAPEPLRKRLMIDDDLRILDDSPLYAIWGAHAMRGHNLVFTGDNELLLTPAVPHPDTGLVEDDAVLSQ